MPKTELRMQRYVMMNFAEKISWRRQKLGQPPRSRSGTRIEVRSELIGVHAGVDGGWRPECTAGRRKRRPECTGDEEAARVRSPELGRRGRPRRRGGGGDVLAAAAEDLAGGGGGTAAGEGEDEGGAGGVSGPCAGAGGPATGHGGLRRRRRSAATQAVPRGGGGRLLDMSVGGTLSNA